MDNMNGYNAYQFSTVNYGMDFAMIDAAMKHEDNEVGKVDATGLTEAKKEEILNQCRDAKDLDTVFKIIDEKVPGGNISELK